MAVMIATPTDAGLTPTTFYALPQFNISMKFDEYLNSSSNFGLLLNHLLKQVMLEDISDFDLLLYKKTRIARRLLIEDAYHLGY
jgi:hypothetical protein